MDKCLHRLFEAQAALRPDAVALRLGDQEMTYGDLNRRANQLARLLLKLGVGPDQLVALCLERSFEMVVCILGIMKAGGAYVPLSPAYPAQRLVFLLQDASAPLLLTQRHLRHKLPPQAGQVRCLEDLAEELRQQPDSSPSVTVRGSDLAYVIYTSGSTGTPKGVMVEHRGTSNTVLAIIDLCGISAGDRLLQFSSLTFDASIWEVMTALGSGATLCLVPQDALLVGEPLFHLLREQAITVTLLPPSILASLPSTELPALRIVISGGEACSRQLVARWSLGHAFWNAYGPTEASVCATIGRCVDSSENPSIGYALPNVRIYLLDEQRQPVAAGAPGELCIGGVAVARGYLRREELTAERFSAASFAPGAAERLYRTGDLARYRPDGSLEFLGRLDHQVKVRGFRIEPEEIEAVLSTHSAVKQCAVAAQPDDAGSQRLIAYVVAPDGQATAAGPLQDFLKERLPEFMLPSAIIFLPALPLTLHGKIDRRALPLPGQLGREVTAAYVAPRTPLHERLVQLWSAVLHVAPVGIDDSFFELGGHSLLAAQLAALIRAELGLAASLRVLFENPSVARLSQALTTTQPLAPPLYDAAVPPAARERELLLSFAQEQVWLVGQLEPDSPLYNDHCVLRLAGPLDAAALESSLHEIIGRHEVWRTSYQVTFGRPIQIIHPATAFTLPILDLWEERAELTLAEREAGGQKRATADLCRPFDLTNGPLLRALLVRLDPLDSRLYLALHHSIYDGNSLNNVFLPELMALYAAFASGKPAPSFAPARQYVDFAAWQRQQLTTAALAPELAFWKRELAHLPVVQLPTDRPRPAVGSFRGARYYLALPKPMSESLTAWARQEGVTLFMTLLAAWAVLLRRYTGQQDLPIATVSSSQTRPELQAMLGMFANTLVLRLDLGGDPSFRELVHRVREVALSAFTHQDVPFTKLVEELRPERQLGSHPLFQVLFLLDPVVPPLPPGWSLSRLELHNGTSMCDLSLQLDDRPEGISGFF